MNAKTRLINTVATGLGRRGFEVRRHPATRRQAMFDQHDVDLVIDVGASTGGYGKSLRSFGYAGQILSFEPLSDAFAGLTATIANDLQWTARNVALGAEAGEATINIASNSTSSSLLPMMGTHLAAAPSVGYIGQETIRVSRLDDEALEACSAHRRPFLKLDTQGFEREVLSGGGETVARCVGLQLELFLIALYDGGMLIDEAIGWAYEHGFTMVGVEQGYAAPSGEILQIDGVFVRS